MRRTSSSGAYSDAIDEKNVYVDGIYEEQCFGGGAPIITKRYEAFGRVFAERRSTPTPGPSTLTYLLSDHLNSTVGTTNTDSEAVDRMQYYPFGSVRSGGVATDRTYTGQQTEAGSVLKLSYYHARFYSAALGHFVSADSMTVDGLNRYAYVGNSPMRYADPSGHCYLGLPCEWSDAQNWIRCALTCGDNWLGAYARLATSQTSFWGRFSEAYWRGGRDNVALFELIAGNATEGTLHTLFTNDDGGNFLSSIFGAGLRSAYFEASLSDVLFGTQRVSGLPIGKIEGASNWAMSEWAFQVGMRSRLGVNGISEEVRGRMGDVHLALALRTVEVARDNAGGDLNSRQWTIDQRKWLHTNGFPNVEMRDVETSYWQREADRLLGCVNDAACLSERIWRNPPDLRHP